MKVVLLQDIKKIGLKGDIKDVADGFARNFLIPKQMVELATTKVIEKIKEEKAENQKKLGEEIKNIRKQADKLQGKKFIFREKSEKGNLFGSVGPREISEEISKKGFEINENMISLKQQIKSVGEFDAIVNLAKDISSKIKIVIEEK